MGLIGMRGTLAARYVGIPILVLTNERLPRDRIRYWVLPSGPDQPYVEAYYEGGVTWDLPFPYGQPVEPDFPV